MTHSLLTRLLAPTRVAGVAGGDAGMLEAARVTVESARKDGRAPDLAGIWRSMDPDADPVLLSLLIKADLRARFERGDRPSAHEYLPMLSGLPDERERVVSVVYEEYCLREAYHESPDPSEFCGNYPDWSDSLRSQLRYHRQLSEAFAPDGSRPHFPEPGEMVLGCKLLARLGRGGTASVYRASEKAVGNREVVLKLSTDRGEEQDVLGRLRHPNIVQVLWAKPRDPETGLRALCMPFQPGVTLQRLLEILAARNLPRRRALDFWNAFRLALDPSDALPTVCSKWAGFPVRGTYADAVAWIGLRLAEALAHAHANGIIHRDLKPANVLLSEGDGPQLLDFNLAHNPHSPAQAEAAMRGGTLPYMAPEQLAAFLDEARWSGVQGAADLFSLGLLLRELLLGRPPEGPTPGLSGDLAVAEMLDRRFLPLTPVRAAEPSVPHALDAILRQCLNVGPAQRPPSAEVLAEDLRRFLARRPLVFARNPSRIEAARNRIRRTSPSRMSVGGVVLGLGVFFAAILVNNTNRTEPRGPLADPSPILAGRVAEALGTSFFGKEATEFTVSEPNARRALAALEAIHPDGSSRWIRRVLAALHDMAGNPGPAREILDPLPSIDPVGRDDPIVAGLGRKADLAALFNYFGSLLFQRAPSLGRDRDDLLKRAMLAHTVAADLDPDSHRAWNGLASCADRMDLDSQALTFAQRAHRAALATTAVDVTPLDLSGILFIRASATLSRVKSTWTVQGDWTQTKAKAELLREVALFATEGFEALDGYFPSEEASQVRRSEGECQLLLLRLESRLLLNDLQTEQTSEEAGRLRRATGDDLERIDALMDSIPIKSRGSIQDRLRKLLSSHGLSYPAGLTLRDEAPAP